MQLLRQQRLLAAPAIDLQQQRQQPQQHLQPMHQRFLVGLVSCHLQLQQCWQQQPPSLISERVSFLPNCLQQLLPHQRGLRSRSSDLLAAVCLDPSFFCAAWHRKKLTGSPSSWTVLAWQELGGDLEVELRRTLH